MPDGNGRVDIGFRPMRVAVVGMGYVGVATAVALAWIGHEVRGVEIDTDRLSRLRRAEPPFYEPGLGEMLAATRERLSFTDSLAEALLGADMALVAVGTPSREDGAADLSHLWAAIDGIAAAAAPGLLVVNKSTAPVGTLEQIRMRLPASLAVACNPEFLRQGQALLDALYPERIVVGAADPAVGERLQRLYDPILNRAFAHPPALPEPGLAKRPAFFVLDPRSAELAKYAANAFLAMKISFANEMANLCDELGADVEQVVTVLGSDPRIGSAYLRPGIGYGGSCFPKDVRALRQMAGESGYEFRLLRAVIEVNAQQPQRVVDKLRSALGGLEGRRIAILGLAFKPGTDDLREAPSLDVIRALLESGADVRAHDPWAVDRARPLLPEAVELTTDLDDVLQGADALVLLTEWAQYRDLSATVLSGMRGRVVVDGRNALSPVWFEGFTYAGCGRGPCAGAPAAVGEMV